MRVDEWRRVFEPQADEMIQRLECLVRDVSEKGCGHESRATFTGRLCEDRLGDGPLVQRALTRLRAFRGNLQMLAAEAEDLIRLTQEQQLAEWRKPRETD